MAIKQGRRPYPEKFRRQLLRKIRDLTLQHYKLVIASVGASRTLANNLTATIDQNTREVELRSPYYWTLFHNDGRGTSRAAPGSFLVWFRNPRDDPRNKIPFSRYPRKRSDRRSLRDVMSTEEFKRLARESREAYRNGGLPTMLVRRVSGPAEGKKFLQAARRGAAGQRLEQEIDALIERETLRYLDEILPPSQVIGRG